MGNPDSATNALQKVERVSDGLPTLQQLRDIVSLTEAEIREYGVTFFFKLKKKIAAYKTMFYSGEKMLAGEVFIVNLQDRLPAVEDNADGMTLPFTFHTHPSTADLGNGSHILPSGIYVENSPEGKFGDLFVIDQARFQGHELLNPLCILTTEGMTLPIGSTFEDRSDNNIALSRSQKKLNLSPEQYGTVIWSVWDNGEYLDFDPGEKDGKSLLNAYQKGFVITKMTEKSPDNVFREFYFISVKWEVLEHYIKELSISDSDFIQGICTSSTLQDLVQSLTKGDLPKQLKLEENLIYFIKGVNTND